MSVLRHHLSLAAPFLGLSSQNAFLTVFVEPACGEGYIVVITN